MSVDQLLRFSSAAFLIIVIPGPSVLFVISRGVALGRKAALATVFGNAFGALAMALLVAFGLGPVLTRSLVFFAAVKWLGAFYLMYLGFKMLRDRKYLANALDVVAPGGSTVKIIREGFIVGLTNPKVLIFFAALMPQFVNPRYGHITTQMVVFAFVFQLIALISDGVWGLLAGTVRTWFTRSPKRLAAIGGIGGLTIMGLGIRLALTGRKD